MGRPGNKRLQRALYGASPSSATGTTTEGEGRYAVTRVTGSVINNGGNMRSGGYPRVGMGLAFLRKTRCNPNCDSFVGTDEDLKTQLTLAREFVAARTTAVTNESIAATTLIAAAAATTSATVAATATLSPLYTPTAVNIAAEADAIKNEAYALADYNAKAAVLAALTTTKNTAAQDYIDAVAATATALTDYTTSVKVADALPVAPATQNSNDAAVSTDLTTYINKVALEATTLAAWIAA